MSRAMAVSLAIFVLAVVFLTVPSIKNLFEVVSSETVQNFHPSAIKQTENAMVAGAKRTERGLLFSSREGGWATFYFPALGEGQTVLSCSFYNIGLRFKNAFIILKNKGAKGGFTWKVDQRYYTGYLSNVIDTNRPFFIMFKVAPDGSDGYWLLESFKLNHSNRKISLPDLPLLFLSFAFGILLCSLAPQKLKWFKEFTFFMAAFAGLAFGAWIPGPFDILVLGIAYLLAMGLLGRKQGWGGSFWGWMVVSITILGFFLRWKNLLWHQYVPLAGDAPGYLALVRNFDWLHPFQTGSREPFFIWIGNLFMHLFPDSGFHFRLLPMVMSVALVPLTYRLARAAKACKPAASGAALLMAISQFSIYISCHGIRLEVYTLLILLFSIFLLRPQSSPVLIGLTGMAICLTRINSLAAVVPLMVIWGWRKKFRQIAVAAVFMLVFLLPYFISVRARTGQFLGHFARHVQWYAAVERTGQPDYHGGEIIPVEDYLFKGRSFTRLAMKLIKGYQKTFLDPDNRFNKILLSCRVDQHWNWILWPFLLLGIAICCFKVLFFPVICLFFLNGLPFALDEYFELRIMFHAAPFFACFTSIGLIWAWNKFCDFRVGLKTKTPQF